jgi:hypothetical protein
MLLIKLSTWTLLHVIFQDRLPWTACLHKQRMTQPTEDADRSLPRREKNRLRNQRAFLILYDENGASGVYGPTSTSVECKLLTAFFPATGFRTPYHLCKDLNLLMDLS